MKAGRIFIALIFIVGVWGAASTGSAIYTRFIYFTVLVAGASWIWTRWAGNSLALIRSARTHRANVGDIFEEYFEVVNHSRVIVPWAEVLNQSLIPYVSGSRVLTLILSKQKRSYLARTWLTRRGAFRLGPTRISTGDPFGLFLNVKEFPSSQSLIVLPMLFDIKTFHFPPGLLPGGQVIRRKSQDITPHAAGVREYVHGDAMKRIHWQTSIRRNKLMVKEFEQDPQAEAWIFVDSQKDVHAKLPHRFDETPVASMLFGKRPKFNLPPSTLEYSVSIAASLTHYFIGKRRAVGFISAGQANTIHAADRGERQEARILETLAFVEADGALSLAALVSAQASQLPQGSSAILITPSTKPDLLIAVDDLQRRYLHPIVILLDSESFGGETGTSKIAQSLRERRVPVCIVPCGGDVVASLSNLSA